MKATEQGHRGIWEDAPVHEEERNAPYQPHGLLQQLAADLGVQGRIPAEGFSVADARNGPGSATVRAMVMALVQRLVPGGPGPAEWFEPAEVTELAAVAARAAELAIRGPKIAQVVARGILAAGLTQLKADELLQEQAHFLRGAEATNM